jgi:hypothetical protein
VVAVRHSERPGMTYLLDEAAEDWLAAVLFRRPVRRLILHRLGRSRRSAMSRGPRSSLHCLSEQEVDA